MIPEPPWTIVYADGAANLYRFEATADEVRFAYEPVTPEQSSTGHYSGGEPRQERLAGDDPRLGALWRHVAALEADRSRHAESRLKGDGAFTVTSGDRTRRFLLARSALGELEALLHQAFRGPGDPA